MTTECPSCGWSRDLPEKFHGRKIKCPDCETIYRVGETPSESEGGGLLETAWFLPTVTVVPVLLLLGGFLLYLTHTPASRSSRNDSTNNGTGSTKTALMGDNAEANGADTEDGDDESVIDASPSESATQASGADELLYANVFSEPRPAPSLPDEFDPFQPPEREIDVPEKTGVAQWTRTAGAGDHLILAGLNFKAEAAAEAYDEFELFGQTRNARYEGEAKNIKLDPYQAMVGIPSEAPQNSMYLIFPRSDQGAADPVPINRTEVWYTVPKKASPGDLVSVVGRNLAHDHEEEKSWIYIKPKGKEQLGQWVSVQRVNPYKVDFKLPDDISEGKYELWMHNGHGERYGWGALHADAGGSLANEHLQITPKQVWDGPTVDITDFGAEADDDQDDTEAIRKALKRANKAKNATLYFPEGTYYISGRLKLTDPNIRLMGDGMRKSFIKGNPEDPPKLMLKIKTGDVLIRDLALVVNELGEEKKYYRGADRGEHNPEHYAWLEKVGEAKDEIKKWKKKNDGQEVPERLKPPPSPGFPKVEARHERVASPSKPKGGDMIDKDVWDGGLRIVNCVLDAERRNISLLKGSISNGMLVNCDIVGREIKLGCPKHARIQNCHFFGRADTGVLMYSYGGWNNVITQNTGQDYMPNTYDTCMGRFFTITAYGNRPENMYIGDNRTKDLTVNPGHHNQNSGEQIMWETLPITSTQKPEEVGPKSLTFKEKVKGKVKWYSDAIIASGKGMGQYIRIAEYDKKKNKITLVRPWKVMPNKDSVIQIGRPLRRAIAYGNSLDGKPRAYNADHHIASAGVEPFGASVEMIVEKNNFHQLKGGIATFSPYIFHYYANNTFDTTRTGISLGKGTGTVVRGNVMNNIRHRAIKMGARGVLKDSLAQDVFANNSGENVPVVFWLKKANANRTVLFYANKFRRGSPDSEKSIVFRTNDTSVLLEQDNQWDGYEEQVAPE